MQIEIHVAQTILESLVEAAQSGQEVVLMDGGRAVAKIVALEQPKKAPFKIGILEGKLGEIPDFLEPMSEEELSLWEGRD